MSAKPRKPRINNRLRVEPATAMYRQLIACLEQRRRELGWSFHKIDEGSGLQKGYAAKCWHPDTKTGRQAGWSVFQWLLDALYPDPGFRIFVVPDVTLPMPASAPPIARLFAVLASAGVEGYQAARLLAQSGIEFDPKGEIITETTVAQKRRDYRRARSRGKLVLPVTKAAENAAAQSLGRFG